MDDKKLDEELKSETGELVSEELKTEKLISEELKTEEIGSSVNIEEGLTQAVEMGEDATQAGNGETGENGTQTGNGEPVEDGTQTENGETGEGVNKTEEAGDEENKTDKMQSEAEGSGQDVTKADAATSKITLNAAWEDEGEEELCRSLFRHSPDTVKKGEPFDLLVLFCALFAIGCMCVMVVSGLNNGFTPSMYVLIACYAVIAFCCLCKPLHFAISKAVWKSGFREKFPIKRSSYTEISLDDKKLYYKDAAGNEISHSYERMTGIYETKHYIVFHEDDKNIFAVNKDKLESGMKEKLYDLIGIDNKVFAQNNAASEDSEEEISEESKAYADSEDGKPGMNEAEESAER